MLTSRGKWNSNTKLSMLMPLQSSDEVYGGEDLDSGFQMLYGLA
jgi:hypothetical protein